MHRLDSSLLAGSLTTPCFIVLAHTNFTQCPEIMVVMQGGLTEGPVLTNLKNHISGSVRYDQNRYGGQGSGQI